jgi:hypothetical protein
MSANIDYKVCSLQSIKEMGQFAIGQLIDQSDLPYQFISMWIDSEGNYCQFLPEGDIYYNVVWTVNGYRVKAVIDKLTSDHSVI